MVADAPDGLRPLEDGVVGGEVLHPQEALAAQLDGIGHEEEHGNPDGHLDEHGQTAAQRRHAILRIHLHLHLAPLHLVFGLVVLLRGLFNLRLQHAHLCTRHVALLHHGEGEPLQQQGDEDEHDAHAEAQGGEAVEDVEREPAVDPTDEPPAQVDQVVEVEVAPEAALFVDAFQNLEVVGTEVHLKLGGFLRVEGSLQLRLERLQIVRLLGVHGAGQVGSFLKLRLRNQHRCEELRLEGHPVERLFGTLVVVGTLAQMVGAPVTVFVGHRGVAILKGVTLLLLAARVAPLHAHQLSARLEESVHALGADGEVQQIAVAQLVLHHDARAIGTFGRERGSGGTCCRGREVQVGRADVVALRGKGEVQHLLAAFEERHVGVASVVLVAQHLGLLHHTAARVDGQLHLVVLQHHLLPLLLLHGSKEDAAAVGLLLQCCLLSQADGVGLLRVGTGYGVHLGLLGLYGCLLLGRLFLAPPAEANQHKGNEHKAGNSIFVHLVRFVIVSMLLYI